MTEKEIGPNAELMLTFVSEHTCFGWNYNKKTINSSSIARKYVDRGIKVACEYASSKKGKEKAIAMIDKDINDQFGILWNYCNEIVRTNPGMSVFMKLTPNEISNKPMEF
ncbi:hypothetical protein H5410_021448 [Solanum commersonii]|uniref:Uncharacterized protein n=1 Tax=Solanum commersonii TaxID=4109 RepID=A0A9J5ZE11_SOLCO|nr:hypothetical protein H5410_021448 [Solanum commersonii]